MSRWVLMPAEALASPHAGGKARALARAVRAGLPVPDGVVVSSDAFAAAAQGSTLAPAVFAEIQAAVRRLSPNGESVAVRSSAIDEDGAEHSFAGQLESFLNVPPAEVRARIRDVWRSGFTDRILAYRREHGLSLAPHAPAVLIQRMVNARAAGVAFSVDPVSGRAAVAVVSAVQGLGDALVSGQSDADTWHVDRSGRILDRRLIADRPALTDAEVQQVAALARSAARHFGRPQDIEWAIDDRLFLLQSRPITSLRSMADPDARLTIWDNSNIVESYSGVTTPLTFSFAREIYEYVYRQFCRMMGVPERTVIAQDETFRNMLGLIRGRLFYNLLNWYRVLAMLPGYQVNRPFMEQMMGVKEPLPDALAAEIAAEMSRGRALDALYLAGTIVGLIRNHLALNRRIDAFYVRLDRALAPPSPALEDRRIDELAGHYRDLRRQLLLAWDAPIVNDFFAMIFYGV